MFIPMNLNYGGESVDYSTWLRIVRSVCGYIGLDLVLTEHEGQTAVSIASNGRILMQDEKPIKKVLDRCVTEACLPGDKDGHKHMQCDKDVVCWLKEALEGLESRSTTIIDFQNLPSTYQREKDDEPVLSAAGK